MSSMKQEIIKNEFPLTESQDKVSLPGKNVGLEISSTEEGRNNPGRYYNLDSKRKPCEADVHVDGSK